MTTDNTTNNRPINTEAANLVELFDRACATYSQDPVFSCLGHTITFAELDQMATSFAIYLQGLADIHPGDRIAIQLPNLLQYPVAVIGALRAGLVVVNTNPLYTARELLHQLEDSGAKALVVLENVAAIAAEVLPETHVKHVITTQVGDLHPLPKRLLINTVLKYVKRQVPAFHLPTAVGFRSALQQGDGGLLEPAQIEPEDVAVLQYTGGTTGVAKGAMLTHRNLNQNCSQIYRHVPTVFESVEQVLVAPLPLYHIYAFNIHLICSVVTGNHSVLVPNPRDLDSLVKVFKNYPVGGFVAVNTLYNALLANREFRQLDFSAMHSASAGGMAVLQDTAERWQELTGLEILQGYGLTEASPCVSSNQPGLSRMGTVGLAMPDTELKVINEAGEALPSGEPGELCVRGPQVMKGYWQRDEETAKVMTADGFLRTGDIAVIEADGYVRIVDRLKDMISVSGLKVFPNEVEDVANLHPKVEEAAAIGVEDEHSGEVVKLVVVAADPSLTAKDLKDFCRERLTGYKVPKHIEFRESLPKSNVGKILRKEIRAEEQAKS